MADTTPPGGPAKTRAAKDDLAADIDQLREDFRKLSDTFSRLTGEQIDRAQVKATDTAAEAEAAIRRNPISAMAIALGLGFLFGVITRR